MSPLRLLLASALLLQAQTPFQAERNRMVREQIQDRGITDTAVLKAMRDTPRHEFMPPSVRHLAYADQPVHIGHQQTISQPYIVAFMSDTLDVKKNHRVLEIGTGSAYQAAILSHLAAEVYTIEIVPELAKSAAATLTRLGYKNVFPREGNGYAGWPEKAPFDRIILTAAPPEIPQALIDQLKPGGKLLAPVGASPLNQEIQLLEKSSTGRITRKSLLPVRFVPMVQTPRQ